MKTRIISLLLCLLVLFGASSCTQPASVKKTDGVAITDDFGSTARIDASSRVVCAYGSFAQCWLLSGGTLVGVTEDAVNERKLDVGESAQIVGTVKQVNVEKVLSLEPDYVILSADITAHADVKRTLEKAGVACGMFRVDSFEDYAALMRRFCDVSGRQDLFKKHVEAVEENIASIVSRVPEGEEKTFLLMRAFSTGIKVKTDNLAEDIPLALGAVSIVGDNPSLLNDLSVEKIITEDPDYIFVLTMGDENQALSYLKKEIESDPAWNMLTAVQNGNYVVLPKDLFHYKPNNRWDESYEYIAKILYPEVFGENDAQ